MSFDLLNWPNFPTPPSYYFWSLMVGHSPLVSYFGHFFAAVFIFSGDHLPSSLFLLTISHCLGFVPRWQKTHPMFWMAIQIQYISFPNRCSSHVSSQDMCHKVNLDYSLKVFKFQFEKSYKSKTVSGNMPIQLPVWIRVPERVMN